jgi:hypothetical protein
LGPLNYQIQNLLNNFNPSTAHSILNQLGSSLVPSHVDVNLLNLIPHFAASQQFQQQQQQSTQHSTTTSNNNNDTTTS